MLMLGLLYAISLLGCHPDAPDYHRWPDGSLLQFEKSIRHDHADPGKLISDYKMPMTVLSSVFSDYQGEYFYTCVDLGKDTIYVGDKSLIKWK